MVQDQPGRGGRQSPLSQRGAEAAIKSDRFKDETGALDNPLKKTTALQKQRIREI
jgi:hypothetical protein